MRVILTLLLLVSAVQARADWEKVGETDAFVAYIDPSTIRNTGQMRRVWALQDLKKRHRNGELSRRLFREYDCSNEKFRLLAVSTHSGAMATKQTLVSLDTPGEWRYMPPGTSAAMAYNRVCVP